MEQKTSFFFSFFTKEVGGWGNCLVPPITAVPDMVRHQRQPLLHKKCQITIKLLLGVCAFDPWQYHLL